MVLHVLGFPHTSLTPAYSSCAFTDRTRVFAEMMREHHEVITYGGPEGSDVPLVNREEQQAWWPWYSPSGQQVFNDFNPEGSGWRAFNERAVAAIRERAKPRDVLCVTMGLTQRAIADALADVGMLAVETGIGYPGVWAPYRVFESWAWRHFLAAKEPTDDVRFFDTVIPRAYVTADFPPGKGDGGYYLFIGRLTRRKGPQIAAETCARLGARLVVAGQGVASVEPGRITTTEGLVLEGDIEYAGVVGPAERAQLMGGAIASFTPTMYLEPFGGVSVEAQMTGTPAITTDWGCFRENVIDDVTGYRCRNLREFVDAAVFARQLDRRRIREHAIATWSTEVIAGRYVAYLEQLASLFGAGWYAMRVDLRPHESGRRSDDHPAARPADGVLR